MPGYAGAVVNPATATINVWWHGQVPPSTRSLLENPDDGVEVLIQPADYSRVDLMSRIIEHRDQMAGIDLAVPREDGSGVVVTYPPSATTSAASAGSIEDMLGVPVIGVTDGAPVNLVGGRQRDGDPWYGGSTMRHGPDNFCSTGFAVLDGIEGRLLSAAHCNPGGDCWWNNGEGQRLTNGDGAVSVIRSADSMLINPIGGTRGRVYIGPKFSTDSRKVAGTDNNSTGDLVATSGAMSGQHRSLNIVNDAFDGDCLGFNCTLIVVDSVGNEPAACHGDSGGPVFHTRSDDRVDAKGILLQGVQGTKVPFSDTVEPTTCYTRARHFPIRPLMNLWNVRIETID